MPDAASPESAPFLLPDLGEGMTEAEVVRWHVAVGDHVARDEIVVSVQTDKAEVELPAPVAGTVTALGAAVGDMVPVGGALLELRPDPGQAVVGSPVRAAPLPAAPGSGAAAPNQPTPATPATPAIPAAQAAPPVRKLAHQLGVDLTQVSGTGPNGRISEADVRAAASGAAGSEGARREPLRGIRRAMAHNMAEAWRAIPHITLFDEIDARPLIAAHLAAREQSRDTSLTLSAFFVRAAVIALESVPILNASFDDSTEDVVYHDKCHVGIAATTHDGLIVPVIHDAHRRDLYDLGREIARLTAAARAGRLPSDELRGATFTVTNFGTEGGRFATPIIRPPQAAVLGFGAIRVRPVVVGDDHGDAVVAAPALPVSLSADHRIVDGHDATGFIEAVLSMLRDPERLVVVAT